MSLWRGVLIVGGLIIVGGIALLRGVGLVIAFWTAFKYMEYSLWIKVPLAALLILTVAYAAWAQYRAYRRQHRH